jgi:hypothetical protein
MTLGHPVERRVVGVPLEPRQQLPLVSGGPVGIDYGRGYQRALHLFAAGDGLQAGDDRGQVFNGSCGGVSMGAVPAPSMISRMLMAPPRH